jgi:ATP-dependent Clp protease ATP-binding subunit ClpB
VDCRDAIFIMTSNLAQEIIAEQSSYLRSPHHLSTDLKDPSEKGGIVLSSDGEKSLSRQFINDHIYPILRHHFKRDEFLGRITEIMYFLPFTENELREIVSKELSNWANKVSIAIRGSSHFGQGIPDFFSQDDPA